MGNCLKTQLKEVVDNNNLLKIGECMFKINKRSLITAGPGVGSTVDIHVMDTNRNVVLTFLRNTTGTEQYIDPGTYILDNKYFIKYFSCGNYNGHLEDFAYMTSLIEFRFSGDMCTIDGNFSALDNLIYVNDFRIYSCNITDNFANYKNKGKLTKLYISANSIPLDISDLGTATKLTTLYLAFAAGVVGNIVDMAANMVSNGRTSGTLVVTGNNIIKNGVSTIGNEVIKTIKFGESMVNPTTEETENGYQIV